MGARARRPDNATLPIRIAGGAASFGIGFANLSGVFNFLTKITGARRAARGAFYYICLGAVAGCSKGPVAEPVVPPAASKPIVSNPSQSAPATRPAELPDTLSNIPDLPELYDADTQNLLPRLAEKLATGSLEGKNFALQQLGAAGEEGALEVMRVLERVVDQSVYFGTIANCCQTLALTKTKNPRAVELLIRALKLESGTARVESAKALGALGDPAALPALQTAFATSDIAVRKVVISAIANINSPNADAALADIAKSDSTAIGFRQAAVANLVLRPIATAEKHLRECLQLPERMGDVALIALAPTGDPQIIQKVRAIAMDPTSLLCGAASMMLAKLQDYTGAIHNLRAADSNVRMLAGLQSIREALKLQKPRGEARAQVIEALKSRVEDPDKTVRIESIRLLVLLDARPDLTRDLESLASSDPVRIAESLDVLTDVEIADRRATKIIIEKMEAAPFARKGGYAQALGRLRDPAAAPFLERYLNGPTERVAGLDFYEYCSIQLSNLGVEGFEALKRGLDRETDPIRRAGLARGLTFFTVPRDAVSSLVRKLASDPAEHPEVRAIALRFLPIYEKNAGAEFLKRQLMSELHPGLRKLMNSLLFTYY